MTRDTGLRDTGQPFDKFRDPSRVSCLVVSRPICKLNLLIYLITNIMNTSIIRQIFQSKFDYPTYCNEIVHNVFGCNDISTHPELLDTTADGDNSYYIGRQTDADGRELGFFYTRVARAAMCAASASGCAR